MDQKNNLSVLVGHKFQGVISPDDLTVWSKSVFDNLDISEPTKYDYRSRIQPFTDFIKVSGLNKNTYLEYKKHLSQKTNISISTKNKYLIIARIYCKELNRQGLIPVDITQNIKSFQQNRKHKKDGLSETEIQLIIDYLREDKKTSSRTRALLSLLILQGLRQIEIVRLDYSDLDLVTKTALILGKGRDDKEIIDLHPTTILAIKTYIKDFRIADGPLFISYSNRCNRQRLTTRSIRNIINPILRSLNIDKTVHGFRHYFTTRLIKSYKGDLLNVAKYTRHKSLEMLQVYNDSIKHKDDLPRYYETFNSINLD